MMLRNLLDEVVRRRLWPILAAAVLVAVAAPLMFLKAAPSGAPAATSAAPAGAPDGKLPARAERLLASTDGARAARKPPGSASDPFQPPSSHAATADAADAAKSDATTSSSAAATTTKPVPVVVTNAGGDTTPASGTTTTATGTTGAPIDDATPAKVAAVRSVRVDVRYGERLPGTVHHAIPRLQTFAAGGRVIAIFVKYSPRRKKAVFAISPLTAVSGDVACRRKDNGLCRYVDIPAGAYARLTVRGTDGRLVSRRIDVVRIGSAASGATAAAAASGAPADGSCLLGRMLALSGDDAALAADACKS